MTQFRPNEKRTDRLPAGHVLRVLVSSGEIIVSRNVGGKNVDSVRVLSGETVIGPYGMDFDLIVSGIDADYHYFIERSQDVLGSGAGGGSAVWGDIAGSLSSQTDLQAELDSKLDESQRDQPNGFAGLDANGNLVGEIIPRTDTLAQLLITEGNEGEIASATDQAAIVKFTGQGQVGGDVFYSGISKVSFTAHVTDVLNIQSAGIIFLTIPASMTVTGLLRISQGAEGDRLSIHLASIESPSLTGLNIFTEGQSQPVFVQLRKTPILSPQIDLVYEGGLWRIAMLSTRVKDSLQLNISTSSTVSLSSVNAIAIGQRNKVLGVNQVSLGTTNIVTGSSSSAVGQFNTTGYESVSIGKDCKQGSGILSLGAATNAAPPWTFTMPDDSFLDNLDFSLAACYMFHNQLQAPEFCLIAYSGLELTLTPSSDTTDLSKLGLDILIYNPFEAPSIGIGQKSTTPRPREFGFSFNNLFQSGFIQFETTTLDSTASVLGAGGYTDITRGPSAVRGYVFTKTDRILSGELEIVARIGGTDTVAILRRQVVIVNIAGTVTVPEFSTLGTDIIPAGLSGISVQAPTILAFPAVTFGVTGIAATTINWKSVFKYSEVS